MKFVHIADMHFDTPFTSLNMKGDLGDVRRLEQRKIFNKIIDYIKENEVDFFFISGDLYEHNYTKKSTIDFINDCFEQIPNTKVFIAPGNHDPYVSGSYYETYNFASNVYVFKGNVEKRELENINVYGMAFNSFYMDGIDLDSIEKLSQDKPNVFLVHCDLNGGKDEDGFTYNNINETKLNALKFNYVAMGHIHKSNFKDNDKNLVVYPGSPISMGFDELGQHGMISGEILENGEVKLEFIKLDDREFAQVSLDVESFGAEEDLVLAIQNLDLEVDNFYKIILVGKRNFEINTIKILKLVNRENVLKIKDKTKLNYNLEAIAKENNLKGYFVREALKKLEANEATEEEIERAIEIGLDAM